MGCGCGGAKTPYNAPAPAKPGSGSVLGYAVTLGDGTQVQFTTQLAAEAYRQARNITAPISEVRA